MTPARQRVGMRLAPVGMVAQAAAASRAPGRSNGRIERVAVADGRSLKEIQDAEAGGA